VPNSSRVLLASNLAVACIATDETHCSLRMAANM